MLQFCVSHFLESITISWILQALPYWYLLKSVVGALESMAYQTTNVHVPEYGTSVEIHICLVVGLGKLGTTFCINFEQQKWIVVARAMITVKQLYS